MRRRSNAAALRCAPGSLRYSVSRPVAKLAPLTAFAALGQSRRVRSRGARCARAAASLAFLGAAYVAADAYPPAALPAPSRHGSMHTSSIAARRAVPGGGDLCGGEHRSSALGARIARASTSDSRRLSERSERSERSEFRRASALREAQRSRSAAETATVGAATGHRPPRRAQRRTRCPHSSATPASAARPVRRAARRG